jgi:hypothetical protein
MRQRAAYDDIIAFLIVTAIFVTMKLTRAPRLFGSSTTTVDKTGGKKQESTPMITESAPNQGKDSSAGKSRSQKSSLVLFKTKLSSRSSNISSSSLPVADPQLRRDSSSNKESSKLSSETTSNENSHIEEEGEADPKKRLDFGALAENENAVKEEQEANDFASVASQKEETELPSSSPAHCVAGLPKNLFKPPKEVMIDPHAVPPSPMKDPAHFYAHYERVPENHALLLQQNPQDQPYHLGDPVGDIAMKRQILDAQRLVRLILGKPLCGDQHLLDTSTILQAIRAFAMMKQELVELRKKQEVMDGDPPAILQELGSPLGTSTTGAQTETTASPAFSFRNKEEPTDAPSSRDTSSWELTEANNRTQILEQQLMDANAMIQKLRNESTGEKAVSQMPQEPLSFESSDEQNDYKYQQLNAKYQQLLHHHEVAIEESRRNLDAVIESVASVPKRVLAKDSVREKLKAYCTTVTHQATQVQIIEMEASMQCEREESRRRLAELEERLRAQEESHQRQLEKLRACGSGDTQHVAVPALHDHLGILKENIDMVEDGRISSKTPDAQNLMGPVIEDEKKFDAQ